MANNTLTCPNCKKTIEITEALLHEFQEEAEKKFKSEIEKVREETEARLRKKFEEEGSIELEDLKKQLLEQKEKNQEFREAELKLREEKRKLEEKEKELELSVERKIDEERKKIEEKILTETFEKQRLKDKEKDKVIEDLKKSLEDAQRKASQGSQQTQGEVLELDIEEQLRANFPTDEIEPVGKGISGADIRQIVKTQRGTVCGVILWETKRAKAWGNDWTEKLKKDLRAEKAHVPIIATTIMPKDITGGIGIKDGVYVCSFELSLVLAEMMRQRLIDVAREKYLAQNKEGNAEQLYSYITSHEFVQQVESILEVHNSIIDQVTKEKVAFEKQWKIRTEQSEKLLRSTARMVGSIQGKIGTSNTLHIKGMDMLELSEGE